MQYVSAQKNPDDVLVVDADPVIADLLATILTEEGYAVRTAANGAAALAALAEQAPALLLIDLSMLGLLASAIVSAARARYPDLPIGIMTTSPAEAVPFLFEPSITCIAKPFDLAVLLAWVGQYLTPQCALSVGAPQRPRTRANGRRGNVAVARVVWRMRDAVPPSAEQAQSDMQIAAPARWQELRAMMDRSAALHARATTLIAQSMALCADAAAIQAHYAARQQR